MFALEMTQKKKGPTYLFDIESPLILRGNAYIDNFRTYAFLAAAT